MSLCRSVPLRRLPPWLWVAPAIGDQQRRQAARDIEFWGASCVAVTDDAPHAETLRRALEQLFGPGTRVADAWTWRF